ncbi:MAG: hypothetical protein ABFS14_07010 [Gemmatimonadota bacterium]
MNRSTISLVAGLVATSLVACGDGDGTLTGPPTGTIEVTISTTGSTLDPDGYTIALDGLDRRVVGLNDTTTFSEVAAGSHSVELLDATSNCRTATGNSTAVVVTAGATAVVALDVSCAFALRDQIAFESTRAGSDIFVMGSDGSNPTNLTGDVTGFARSPSISPDGTKIAFHFERDLFVMDADGTNRTLVVANSRVGRADWSPDGAWLVFAGGSLPPDIFVVRPDGSDLAQITHDSLPVLQPDWAPDGVRIVYTRSIIPDNNVEVYLMNADGSDQRNLTNNPTFDFGAAWSPDGTRIAFDSVRDGDGEVFVMNADGSDQVNLTDNAFGDGGPTWSPDGTRIAFLSTRDGNGEIYVMNADGSGQTNISNNPASDSSPSWGP